jgi:hypothetical protein
VRRVLGGLLIVVLSLAAVVAVVLILQSRDDAEVGSASGPGEKVEARCPDEPAGIAHDSRPLTEDQIRQATSLGNVVLRYSGSRPPSGLRELQDELTGPYDAEIAAAGQAVILAAGGDHGIEALAWGHRQRVSAADDPLLRTFVESWLGEAAPEPCPKG